MLPVWHVFVHQPSGFCCPARYAFRVVANLYGFGGSAAILPEDRCDPVSLFPWFWCWGGSQMAGKGCCGTMLRMGRHTSRSLQRTRAAAEPSGKCTLDQASACLRLPAQAPQGSGTEFTNALLVIKPQHKTMFVRVLMDWRHEFKALCRTVAARQNDGSIGADFVPESADGCNQGHPTITS